MAATSPVAAVSTKSNAAQNGHQSFNEKTAPEGPQSPLYAPHSGSVPHIPRRIKKRKDESPIQQFFRWFDRHQTGVSFNLFALLFLTHVLFSRSREFTTKFFTLGYYNDATGRFGVGRDDAYFVFFCITLFTGMRACFMHYIGAPFARFRGLEKPKDITRFTEQAWLVMYYNVFWPWGLYMYYKSPYWLNNDNLWTAWPDREIDGQMKVYMLAQLGFWLQQILVINIEERRKDHWQMFTHHIVTNALIIASYRYHFTRVGHLILVLLDIVDLFFPLAKCLKYLGHGTICDVLFGLFMGSWLFGRHIFYMMVCRSAWSRTTHIIPYACFDGSGPASTLRGPLPYPSGGLSLAQYLEPLHKNDGLICFDERVKWAFISVLFFLQAIMLVWFCMIVRVAIRVIKGAGAEDPRTDDEEEDEDEIDAGEKGSLESASYAAVAQQAPVEEEVGVEDLDLKGWQRRQGVKRQASATGVSLPGHSDRKELLGRIGCEKQVD